MAVLISGPRVMLRDRLPSDADRYVYWMTHGEWLEYDAPWEDTVAPLTEQEIKHRFVSTCSQELPCPRRRAMIATLDNRPLGWVNWYGEDRYPSCLYVGIDICEDEYLNRGIGTEALTLWVGYLFAHTDLHCIGLETWSFNPRMMRAAEKVGFVYEGAERERMQWRGQWLDLVHFGLLRREWEGKSK